MSELTFTIHGALKSKANSRMAVKGTTKTGKTFTRFIKSQGAFDFVEGANLQLRAFIAKNKLQPIADKIGLEMDIYYPSNRSDLSPELFLDCLQSSGLIVNDRQVVAYSCRKLIDKEDPRVVCWLYTITD